MSPPSRLKGEYRSAQHGGLPMSPQSRLKGEYPPRGDGAQRLGGNI